MKTEVKGVKLSKSEMKEIKGGGTYKYYCLHNNTPSIFLYNNESKKWYNILGSEVPAGELMNCGDCDPRNPTLN